MFCGDKIEQNANMDKREKKLAIKFNGNTLNAGPGKGTEGWSTARTFAQETGVTSRFNGSFRWHAPWT